MALPDLFNQLFVSEYFFILPFEALVDEIKLISEGYFGLNQFSSCYQNVP
jgi:hypothetical protein